MAAESFESESLGSPDRSSALNMLQMLWQHKSLIVLGGVVGLVLGGIYYAQLTPIYHSSTQVMVIKKDRNPLPASDQDPRSSYYEDYLSTHSVLIRSPLIVGRAVDKHKLQGLRSFQGQGNPTGAIRGALVVARDSKDPSGPSNSILNLDYRGTDSADCPVILNAVIDAYREFLDEKYKNVSDATLAQIVRAMESVQKDLKEKRENYLEFQLKSPLVYLPGSDTVSTQDGWLAQIQSRRMGLVLRRAEAEARLDAIENASKEGKGRRALLAQMLASQKSAGGERRMDEQIFELQIREQMLLADYGKDHPDVVSVRRRIELTRNFLTQDLSRPGGEDGPDLTDPVQWHIHGLRQELADIDISLKATAKLTEAESKDARQVMRYKLEDRHFREEIVRLQQMFEPILRRLEEIKLVRDLGGYDAQTIAPPGPGGRTGTGLIRALLMAGALGLMGGVGLAYLAEVTDKTFRNPDEIRSRLGLPVVGHIPLLSVDESKMEAAAANGIHIDAFICTYYGPKSIQAEAYRGIRTALYFSTRGEGHKIIQVTSPNKGDGKSTTTANLAVCIAQSGKRVLLIDADLRKPRQHRIFGMPASKGLATVIADEVEWKEAVLPTPVEGLSLLPAGPIPSNPAELLSSTRFQELLETLRGEYDFVLVDTPPLLAVSDPSVVAPRVDGILLAIRIAKNGRPAAERAREVLSTLGAKVLGVIVNGGGAKGAGYGDGGRYGYGDQYGYAYQYGYGHGSEYYRDEESETTSPPGTEPSSVNAPKEQSPSKSSPRGTQPKRKTHEALWDRVTTWFRS
ncbi:MAG: polysaccharide biosynthesis tyrosine autokinase [Gemmataceae bacterium]|nr:polysaccharide biosynthesis tyrosine autokinase [Gemmataceae bacterium]